MGTVFKASSQPLEVDIEKRTFRCCLSRPELDRDGEYIEPEAFRDHLHVYLENPILLLGHEHKTRADSLPIGKALDIEIASDGVYGTYYVASTKVGDDVLTLLNEGILRGISAGFIPKDAIPNPTDYQVPVKIKGKGAKKWYRSVELVEVSLLAIPSNRNALVMQAEKGNSVAELIVKMFDMSSEEDISHTINEWIETKFWDETKINRDDSGKFSDKPGTSTFFSKPQTSTFKTQSEQLDEIIRNQEEIKKDLKKVKDKDSWGAWAKKWAIRIGAVVGGYYFLKSKTGQELKGQAKAHISDWLKNKVAPAASNAMFGKGASLGNDLLEAQKLTRALDDFKRGMDRAKRLGAQDSPEYKKMLRLWTDAIEKLGRLVSGNTEKSLADFLYAFPGEPIVAKGLGNLLGEYEDEALGGLYHSYMPQWGLKGFMGLVQKDGEWTEEDEKKHPRKEDGKFRSKDQSEKVEGKPQKEKKQPFVETDKTKKQASIEKRRATIKAKAEQRKNELIYNAVGVGVVTLLTAALYLKTHKKTANDGFKWGIRITPSEYSSAGRRTYFYHSKWWEKDYEKGFWNRATADDGSPLSWARLQRLDDCAYAIHQMKFSDKQKDSIFKGYERFRERYAYKSGSDNTTRYNERRIKSYDSWEENATAQALKDNGLSKQDWDYFDNIATGSDMGKKARMDKMFDELENVYVAKSDFIRNTKANAGQKIQYHWTEIKRLQKEDPTNFKAFRKHYMACAAYTLKHEYSMELRHTFKHVKFLDRSILWTRLKMGANYREWGSQSGGRSGNRSTGRSHTTAGFEVPEWRDYQTFKQLRDRIEILGIQFKEGRYTKSDVGEFQASLGAFKKYIKRLNDEVGKGTPGSKEAYDDALKKVQVVEDIIEELKKKGLWPDLIVIKGDGEWTEEDEKKHPRKEDGKFRSKDQSEKVEGNIEGIDAKKASTKKSKSQDYSELEKKSIVAFGQEKGQKFYNWAKNNKGKIAVATATIPMIFTTSKVISRSVEVIGGRGAKALVNWDDVVAQGTHLKIFKQMQPGDVILSGTMPHQTIGEVAKDLDQLTSYASKKIKNTLSGGKKNVRGKVAKVGDLKDLAAYDRISELFSKIAGNGQYQHAFMVAGHFNEESLARIQASPHANKIIRDLIVNINAETAGRSGIKYIKNGKPQSLHPGKVKQFFAQDPEFYKKVDLSKYYGHPMRVGTSKGIPNFGLFIRPHSGTQTKIATTACIVRPKIDEKGLKDVANGVWSDVLNQVQTDAFHPWDTKTLIRPMTSGGLLDPVTGRVVRAMFRNDRMVCSGVVAKLFERYGHKRFADASLITPMELLRDDKFAKDVLVPRMNKETVSVVTETPEKLLKRETGGIKETILTGAAIGTGTVGTAAALNNKEEKSIDDLVLKWTKETFEEDEVKRDGGKFAKEDGAPAKPKSVPGQRGGARPGAGRLPNEAHKAVEKIKERVVQEHPDWDDNQIKVELLKQAEERNKPDWEEYINNPQAYIDRMKQEAADIAASKRGKLVHNNKVISNVDSSADTADIKTKMATSKRAFDREVEQQKSIKKAWNTFRNKEVDETERNRQKLIFAASVIASTIGAAAVLTYGRPKIHNLLEVRDIWRKDRAHEVKQFLESRFDWFYKQKRKVKDNKFGIPVENPGDAKTVVGALPLGPEGHRALIVPPATWLKMLKVIDMPKQGVRGVDLNPFTQIDRKELGWFQRKMGEFTKKYFGEEKILSLGEEWHGYGKESRFNPFQFDMVDRYMNKHAVQSTFKVGTSDPFTGITLVKSGKNGEPFVDPLALFNAKQMWRVKGTNKPLSQKVLMKEWGLEYVGNIAQDMKQLDPKQLRSRTNMEVVKITNPELFEKKWQEALKKHGPNTTEWDVLPRYLAIPSDATDHAVRRAALTDEKGNEIVTGYGQFLNQNVFPAINRKVLATLALATGASPEAYYFLQQTDLLRSENTPVRDEAKLQNAIDKVRERDKLTKAEKKKNESREDKKINTALNRSKKDKNISEAEKDKAVLARMKYEDERKEKLARALNENDDIGDDPDVLNVKTQGYNGNVVVKEYTEDEPNFTLDQFTDWLADETVKMFTDTSACCRMAIESGMPGHEGWEQLNDCLVALYQEMKTRVEFDDERIAKETEMGIPQE